jgi:glutamate-1-semialdehyde 2,1-aminomutase
METIIEEYTRRFSSSRQLYEQALALFPNGVTHDGRYAIPFPLYIERAEGSKKWDVEGRELIDYWMGHGSLLLGHGHPEVLRAMQEQIVLGTHYGACHRLEVEWAEWVMRLVPSAERVRFTSSGTEATMMAIRLARIFTGKTKVVRFQGHFHGWHDTIVVGYQPPYYPPSVPGIPPEVVGQVLVSPPNDIGALEHLLTSHNDIACVIIEPTGASFGLVPTAPGFLKTLREMTTRRRILLIFDEVITGFRCAPGGAQAYFGVTPDITTLAKILAGGLPGGCVTGRREIIDLLAFQPDDPTAQRKMLHHGTFNANPLSAAAGVATLSRVASGEDIAVANARAEQLKKGFGEVVERHGVDWLVYGHFSDVKVLLKARSCRSVDELLYGEENHALLRSLGRPELVPILRYGMLLYGVDFWRSRGMVSSAHAEADIEKTVEVFDTVVGRMRREGHV